MLFLWGLLLVFRAAPLIFCKGIADIGNFIFSNMPSGHRSQALSASYSCDRSRSARRIGGVLYCIAENAVQSRRISQLAEVGNAMEGRIVRIVKIVRAVARNTAKVDNILTVKLEIHVLESDVRGVNSAIIVQILCNFPMLQIVGG